MVKSLGVIGGGVLGRAVARGFLEHIPEVKVFDNIKERATHTVEEAATCDVVMICLPTPAKPNGVCDTTAIDDFLDDAKRNKWWTQERCYVIRSTVPVGYTMQRWDIAQQPIDDDEEIVPLLHSPESLTARCALTDFQIPARNIIGMPYKKACESDLQNESWLNAAASTLQHLYQTRFPGVQCLIMSSNESELVKLACNAFFATKVTFFNAIHQTANQHGCDWNTIRAGILSDGRIAHAHTQVPGPSGELGYGGACLSKDTASLRTSMKARCAQLLWAVERTNADIRGEAGPQLVSDHDPEDKHGIERTLRNARESQEIVAQANIGNQTAVNVRKAEEKYFAYEAVREYGIGEGKVQVPFIKPEGNGKPNEILALKAQVIRMAHLAARALMNGVRPTMVAGLVSVIEEAGFKFEPPFGGHVKDQIEAALEAANRAVANCAVAKECGQRPGQLRDENGIPLWYHPSTNGQIRAHDDDGWMDVGGWMPLTAEKMKVAYE